MRITDRTLKIKSKNFFIKNGGKMINRISFNPIIYV